jgi:hypothetical protein
VFPHVKNSPSCTHKTNKDDDIWQRAKTIERIRTFSIHITDSIYHNISNGREVGRENIGTVPSVVPGD